MKDKVCESILAEEKIITEDVEELRKLRIKKDELLKS